jgi:hypothetical protein
VCDLGLSQMRHTPVRAIDQSVSAVRVGVADVSEASWCKRLG